MSWKTIKIFLKALALQGLFFNGDIFSDILCRHHPSLEGWAVQDLRRSDAADAGSEVLKGSNASGFSFFAPGLNSI